MRVALKAAIHSAGKAQRQVAAESEIDENRLSQIVRGWTKPTFAPPNTAFQTIGVNMHDSQMEELRARQVDEICRFHGIAPMLIGAMGRATWGNYGEAREQFFTQTIMPWLVNIESELMLKLISPLERGQQLIAFNAEGSLRGNATERVEFYTKMVNIGAYSINEVRALENKPPLPGGDAHFKPMNTEPITAPEPEP